MIVIRRRKEGRKGVSRVELFLRVEGRLHFFEGQSLLSFALFPRKDTTQSRNEA